MEPKQLLAAASIVALTLSACSSGTGGGGATGGTAVAYLAEPATLDPTLAATVTDSEVIQRLFDPLVHYNPTTAEVEFTGAAESADVADDGMSITFQLREGATFHNGEPVDAAAFIRALSRVASKDTASEVAYHLDGLVGFGDLQAGTATDFAGVAQGATEYELVFTFDEPNPEFLIRTGHTVFSPIPESAEADFEAFSQAPVGNGAYMMDGVWRHNDGIDVVRNEDYDGGLPGNLDRIEWKIFSELQGGYLEFQGETLDTAVVPPENLTEAADTYGDEFIEIQTAVLQYLQFRGVDDPALRRAISLGIDPEAINQAVFSGTRVAATSFVPPANTGYRAGACTYCIFDVDAATAELEDATDVPDVLEFTYNSGAGHEDWVGAAAAQVEENLGITTRVVPGSENFGDYLGSLREITGVFRIAWGQDYPTPDNWLAPFFLSTSGDNFAGYENPDFDAKINEARRTIDDADRLALYAEAEDILVADMPAIPMFYGKSAILYDSEAFSSFPIDVQLGIPAWENVTAVEA